MQSCQELEKCSKGWCRAVKRANGKSLLLTVSGGSDQISQLEQLKEEVRIHDKTETSGDNIRMPPAYSRKSYLEVLRMIRAYVLGLSHP